MDLEKGIADFYSRVNRRALLDVTQDEEEQKFWVKSFEGSNDLTLYSWRNEWLKNTKENLNHFGYFHRDRSAKIFYNELLNLPVVLVGAGSSLQSNIQYLKLAKEMGIKILSCHHSLMYLSDIGVTPDYVVALDAGCMWDDYFALDKGLDFSNVPLIAEQGCNTEQLKKWPGKVVFFKSAHPDKSNIAKYLKMELDRILPAQENSSVLEVGGHVMGAMMSVARGIMQANTMIFTGTDYVFSPEGKFYPFDHKIDQEVDGSHFDKPGQMLPAAPPQEGAIYDIFGNLMTSNGAYLGFKNVMDQGIKINMIIALQQGSDLEFVNACEGGALGALNGGNSKWMRYSRLEDALYAADAKRKIKK